MEEFILGVDLHKYKYWNRSNNSYKTVTLKLMNSDENVEIFVGRNICTLDKYVLYIAITYLLE